LKERTDNRDKTISLPSFRAQLKAIHQWAAQAPSDLSGIPHPVLVANGESDRMVPSPEHPRPGRTPAPQRTRPSARTPDTEGSSRTTTTSWPRRRNSSKLRTKPG